MKAMRLLFDNFTLALLGTVLLAVLLPAHGDGVRAFEGLATAAIALLFFLHGTKLSREAVIAGAAHWWLHLLVFGCTFVLFPLLGLALKPLLAPMTGAALYTGIIYLCTLPATVQSAIAFTSIARGNVPAAICSAAASSLLGIVVTPLLVMGMLGASSGHGVSLDAMGHIVLQLLVPFVAGQLARRWLGGWISRHARLVKRVDQGSILLVVYTAFSASVVEGLWKLVPVSALLALVLACCVLLAAVLVLVWWLSGRLGFTVEDRITILFAGSKKSLASGVPMAQVLFAGTAIGPLILPLMLFHQIQLMACTVLAQRFARRGSDPQIAARQQRA